MARVLLMGIAQALLKVTRLADECLYENISDSRSMFLAKLKRRNNLLGQL